jgi:hypothetical protein
MDYLFGNIYKYITEDRGRIARDIRKSLGNPMGFWNAKKAGKKPLTVTREFFSNRSGVFPVPGENPCL